MTEPRTWTLPEEPPVGTVVGPADWDEGAEPDLRRFKRIREDHWVMVDAGTGEPKPLIFALMGVTGTWLWVLGECSDGVIVVPDPADPDGRQAELDKLRADVARLDRAVRDGAENLAQAEQDRDAAGESARLWRMKAEEQERQRQAFERLADAHRETAQEWQRKWRELSGAEASGVAGPSSHDGAVFLHRSSLDAKQPVTFSVHRDETWGGFELRMQRDGESAFVSATVSPRHSLGLAAVLIEPSATERTEMFGGDS